MKASDLPLYYNAVNILEHNLATRPNKAALFTPERELTFRQAADEVNQLGNALKRLDVRMGEYVGILSLDCAEWAIAYFACMKIGAIAVGMNTLLKPHEHVYTLKDCRARALIIHKALLPALNEIREQLDFVKHIIVIGGGQAGDLDYVTLIK
ncbi:MAG: AMP-binding protein, partial [Anaerolineales bacterium]